MSAPLDRWRRWLSPRYAWARFTHNLGPKLLALGVALTLWFLATADRRANVDQGFDVPVTVRDTTGNGQEKRAVGSLTPPSVRVILSGRPERLRELEAQNIEAVVDVTGIPEGSFTQPVTVTPPTGTAVQRLTPTRVQGFVDTQVQRTLPVTLSVTSPPESSVPRYVVSPTEASVTGAGQTLAQVTRIITSPAALAAGAEQEVPLVALSSAGLPVTGVTLRPATVTVRRLDTGELPVKTLPVVLNDPPPTLIVTAISVQPSTVRVVAAPELLGRLREVSGTVTYRVGTSTVPVRLSVPAGAQALEAVSVRLTVAARPVLTPPVP
ncbi:CdaR family protein [Deinococcus arboris]|uniref:CdaR family protein n=1 Tax=Deinococcus arboris TaxID=2682977 RepID=UPI0034E277A8